MPDDFMAQARKRPERSLPPIRAAARMRIARVQSAVDSSPEVQRKQRRPRDGFDRNRER